jgi:phosphate starvation-inducible PhoH-like protein
MSRPEVPPLVSTPLTDGDGEPISADIEVADRELLMQLTGASANRLPQLERLIGLNIGLRGDTIRLQGAPANVFLAERVLTELVELVRGGLALREGDLEASVRLLRDHPNVRLTDVFRQVVITSESGAKVAPRGLAQRLYVQTIEQNDIVFGVGPAGTGKTYLAVAMAVSALSQQRVKRIVLTRPAIEAGEKLGFLPGDLAEKVDPYLRPLYDAIHDMLPVTRVRTLIERGTIEVAPLAFMRGRTLADSFVILDEAQNTTVPQMRMLLTRLGQRSKAVITGDPTQVDLPGGVESGLGDALPLLDGVEGIGICHFSSADVVRHPLVQRVVDAYERRDREDHAQRRGHRGQRGTHGEPKR